MSTARSSARQGGSRSAFIHSKLTPLLLVASVLLGALAVWQLPREEEPQIIVPMIDVFVRMPGARRRRSRSASRSRSSGCSGRSPASSTSTRPRAPASPSVIVRFKVGEDEERASSASRRSSPRTLDIIPPGASAPLVKPRSIDDVPVLAVTLWSKRYSGYELRRVAAELQEQIKQVPASARSRSSAASGGSSASCSIPSSMAAHHLSPLAVAAALGAANQRLPAGALVGEQSRVLLETGTVLANARDVGDVVVSAAARRASVFLRDVATIVDGPEEPSTYVRFGGGAAAEGARIARPLERVRRPRSRSRSRSTRGRTPSRSSRTCDARSTRSEGTTHPRRRRAQRHPQLRRDARREKSNELLKHMGIAVVSVGVLIWLALGGASRASSCSPSR